MAPQPEITVVVSTYNRPNHLRLCLLSLHLQVGVQGLMEVVIADDGSSDETLQIVERFSQRASFPIRFTTHQHRGFRLAMARNDAVVSSEAPYLLFVDGDCILPPDYIKHHLSFRRPGFVVGGDCVRLSALESDEMDERAIFSRKYLRSGSARERRRLRTKTIKDRVYSLRSTAIHPRLTGNCVALFRSDFAAVNGFDENFVGWGLEDRDLQRRLYMAGCRVRTSLHRTHTYHVWHEPTPSFMRNNSGTQNLIYFQRDVISPECRDGLCSPRDTTFRLYEFGSQRMRSIGTKHAA